MYNFSHLILYYFFVTFYMCFFICVIIFYITLFLQWDDFDLNIYVFILFCTCLFIHLCALFIILYMSLLYIFLCYAYVYCSYWLCNHGLVLLACCTHFLCCLIVLAVFGFMHSTFLGLPTFLFNQQVREIHINFNTMTTKINIKKFTWVMFD